MTSLPLPIQPSTSSAGLAASASGSLRTRYATMIRTALFVIVVAAAVLRFSGLDREGRWGDEYHQTRSYVLPPLYVVLGAQTQHQPPLDYLIGWALAKIDQTDWMRRAPAAFFGVVGVVLAFFLVRRLHSPIAGLIAAAMLCVSPLHGALSQEARPYTICTAAMILTFWMLLRALDQPSKWRLLAYMAAAYTLTLTRALLPLVVLLMTAVVLLGSLAIARKRRSDRNTLHIRSVRRVLVATVIVGLAAVPMLVFLLQHDVYTVFTEGGRQNGANFGSSFSERLREAVFVWFHAPAEMFGKSYLVVLSLAVAGVVRCVRASGGVSSESRIVLTAMALTGPVYLLVFAATVSFVTINNRYAMFLVPIIAAFAALGASTVLVYAWRVWSAQPLRRWAVAGVAMLLLLAAPASETSAMVGQFSRPDWRGCAGHLSEIVTPDDVVMVFRDRPLGEPQTTFWGKYDWPDSMQRPLAEPAWTLASSESHWKRLQAKSGRCFLVLRYEVTPQAREAFRNTGLKSPPTGVVLTKFRGLDLLVRGQPAESASRRMIQACNDLLAISKVHPDSDAILYALRSRLELEAGDSWAAQKSLSAALKVVPTDLLDWFLDALDVHVHELEAGIQKS